MTRAGKRKRVQDLPAAVIRDARVPRVGIPAQVVRGHAKALWQVVADERERRMCTHRDGVRHGPADGQQRLQAGCVRPSRYGHPRLLLRAAAQLWRDGEWQDA